MRSVEMNLGILCGSLLLWPQFFRHFLVENPIGDSVRSILSRIAYPSNRSSKASKSSYSGKTSTQYSNRRSAKKEGFELQPSEASLELGDGGGMSSTTIEAGTYPEYLGNIERSKMADGGITRTQDITIVR